jgi:hypothetical protein
MYSTDVANVAACYPVPLAWHAELLMLLYVRVVQHEQLLPVCRQTYIFVLT